MNKLLLVSLVCLSSLFLSSCLELTSGSSANTQTSDTNSGSSATATGCTQNYTTADLNGCFSKDNSSFLEYYCFDGNSGWYKDFWTPISGCATTESGNYLVSKCTLTVCDTTGCDDYQVQATDSGILVDNEPYSDSKGCN